MPIKRPLLENDEIYHVVLRGVGDTTIFNDKNDYYRGIFSIFEFNDKASVLIKERRRARLAAKKKGDKEFSAKRQLLIEILTFCFMPNHIHLLVRQLNDNGITNFMRKLGAGYAAYFNRKYSRKGHLFQNRFKAVQIKNDRQLEVVFNYIHTNPVSLIDPDWKEKGIRVPQKTINFLNSGYKWSSYQDYIKKKNFPSITERDFLSKIMGGPIGCRKSVENWIKHKREILGLDAIALE